MADLEDDAPAEGSLFRNIRFWVAQRVPLRSNYVEQIKVNGGLVVPLEKNADIMIADHLRSEAPPGSYSYTWIEESIKQGELQDKEAHRAGPSAGYSRPPGSSMPAKTGGRNAYTVEDDRVLYEWVRGYVDKGGAERGNEIYRQLEQVVRATNRGLKSPMLIYTESSSSLAIVAR